MDRIIAIDSGRSGVKCVDESMNKRLINAMHGYVDLNNIRQSPNLLFNPDRDFIVSVDGKHDESHLMTIGVCTREFLPPEDVQYVTEDKIYMEYSLYYILVGIAKFINNGDRVYLVINLTKTNFKYAENEDTDYVKSLSGKHTVKFYNNQKMIEEKTFEVTGMNVQHQGVGAVMYMAIDDKTWTLDPMYKKEGLVLDFGRETVVMLDMMKFNIRKPRSPKLGSEYIFKRIADMAFNEYDIQLSALDVEEKIVTNTPIILNNGREVKLIDFYEDALKYIAEKIKNEIWQNFNYNPAWILLTGGGINFFGKILIGMFVNAKVVDDPIFANAMGLMKLALMSTREKKSK